MASCLLANVLIGLAVAAPVDFPVFWRNQTNAALRVRLCGTAETEARLTGSLAGEAIAPRAVRLGAGETHLAVPLDPARLRAGKYPWKLRLTAGNGTDVWRGSGEFEVRPRLARDAFKLVSWGGWKRVPDEYLLAVGINTTMADVFRTNEVRRQVAAGFFPNLRYENLKRYRLADADLDPDGIRATARRDFAPYEGFHAWTATLVNSEVYGSAYPQKAGDRPEFLAWARRELGFEPDFRYRNAPIELDPDTVGVWPTGVVARGSCPQLDTLCWVMARGMTPYLAGRFAAEAIHGLDAGNTVWSEPAFEGIPANLDMLADWHYQYRTDATVRELRACAARCRPYGKPYMPTLSAGYYHGFNRPKLARAVCSGRRKMPAAQSADEVAIKAYLALAAVPTHALSFFALDSWSEGERMGIAEPGTGARFGRIWRERIAPVADLLRDLPNERAPLAVVRLSECRFASGLGWGQVHHPASLETILAKVGVPYDVLYDRDVETGVLAGYRHAFLPMAKTIYADHVAQLAAAAAAGCRIATDAYAATNFVRGVRLGNLTHPYDFRRNRHLVEAAFLPWVESVLPDARKAVTAWSDGDGATSHTFVKVWNGVRYVTVVNDRRSDGPGFLNGCVTNDWYRPYGAPQRIVTHLNVPEGSAVYEFGTGLLCSGEAGMPPLRGCGILPHQEGNSTSIATDYGPAEAKVFCIYPKRLAGLAVKIGKAGIGSTAEVAISLDDVDGTRAPGRQVIAIEVRDPDGALHDETGRYAMEGGRLKIPLRPARDDPRGKWRARVTELTSGLAADVTW